MTRVNVEKVLERIEEIYLCGKKTDDTYERLAFSLEDTKGREKFISYFKSLGIPTRIDSAGNIIARLEGENKNLPSIMVGSHLDTVPKCGKYDGVLGCVAGLGVCEALVQSKHKLQHPLEIIVFTDEEGSRFGNGLFGSSMFTGIPHNFSANDKDIYGNLRKDVLKDFGIDFLTANKALCRKDKIHCFLELHIEQGASLYKSNVPIGIVSTISGVKRYEITVKGESNHSGSTLMCDRNDALVKASEFIYNVPKIVEKWGNEFTVATVGIIKSYTGAVNVIPRLCEFSLEIRDQELKVINLIESKLNALLDDICKKDEYTFKEIFCHNPAPMTDWIKDIIKSVCEYEYSFVPSGAFHDALIMSEHFNTGMIFIPSVDGISHLPTEFSTREDIEKGCDVLLKTILEVDKKNNYI